MEMVPKRLGRPAGDDASPPRYCGSGRLIAQIARDRDPVCTQGWSKIHDDYRRA